MYRLDESKQAAKDYETAKRAGHGKKLDEILTVMERAPYEPTPGHRFFTKNQNADAASPIHTNRYSRLPDMVQLRNNLLITT